jgi:hypothetical protein
VTLCIVPLSSNEVDKIQGSEVRRKVQWQAVTVRVDNQHQLTVI